MFRRRRPQPLEVELTMRGLTVFWECSPGVVVRRTFPTASLGCAAVEALRTESPRTLEESILVLDRIARTRPVPHPINVPGPSNSASRSNVHRRS